jgi:hypothetical protein
VPVLVSSVSRRARLRRFWASLSFPFRGARIVCLLVGFPSTIKRFVLQVGFPSTFKTVVLAAGFPSAVRTVPSKIRTKSGACNHHGSEKNPRFVSNTHSCSGNAVGWWELPVFGNGRQGAQRARWSGEQFNSP